MTLVTLMTHSLWPLLVKLVFARKRTRVICDVSFHLCFIQLITAVQHCSAASWQYGDRGKVCSAAKVLIGFI